MTTWKGRPVTSEAASKISGDDQRIRSERSTSRRRKRWTAREVAELVELAYDTAVHQARVAPVEVVEREAQPFRVRVAERARALESARWAA